MMHPRPPRTSRRWIGTLLLLVLGVGGYLALAAGQRNEAAPPPIAEAAPESAPAKKKRDPKAEYRRAIDDFFADSGPTPTFNFDLIPQEWEYLKKDPRRYAEATMWEASTDRLWRGVAVKCKGSAGSFQNPEQKPGLSISMNKYKGAERWDGFLKWHLNNGAQDASLLNEQISCEIARAAGVPASRCAHAFVKLQGRELGLYLFKEAFDQDFLSHFFKQTDGDLYDGGFVHDVDVNMEKDEGDPDRRENVKELIAACQEGDLAKRHERLAKILDIDRFLSFLAIEAITTHWDGYNFNRNNYRLYFDSETGEACFFLHGTDQTFNDANAPITRDPGSLVGAAVMSNPEWKKGYRERVEKIYNEVLKPIDWPARVGQVGEKVRAALEVKNPQWAKDYVGLIDGARHRVADRITAIGKQLGDLPHPFKFDAAGLAVISAEGWHPEGGGAAIDTADKDGKACLHLKADGDAAASWRRPLALEPGKYRIEARLRTAGVVGSKGGSGEGAGLRISGGTRAQGTNGDTDWQDVTFPIESSGGEVVIVAELRGKGEVWFERDSFRLRQVK